MRFHKFTIGWAWKSDYGSSETKEGFDVLYKYSPLHNVKEGGKYPPLLVVSGDHDDRVVPSHSFKYVATHQEKADPESLCLMRLEKDASHSGGVSKSKRIAGIVEGFAFLERALGPIDQNKFKAQLAEAAKASEPANDNRWAARVKAEGAGKQAGHNKG